jgi:acyl-CoA hydrolase
MGMEPSMPLVVITVASPASSSIYTTRACGYSGSSGTYAPPAFSSPKIPTNTAWLVYVALNDEGTPTPVPPLLAETEEEKRKMTEALERQERRLKKK